MFQINEINFNYLKNKKVLVLSDTFYPHLYITEFIKKLSDSQVFIYISPATTSGFVKLWMKIHLNKKVKIIKDKNYKMFFTKNIDDYEIVIIFGKNKNQEQKLLQKLLKNMLVSYRNITVVTYKGIDCDENYTL
jgi:nitrogenase molybdenum-iron protein alpha/beta subunit